MNEFSLEVALIWARANAEASVCQTAKDFSASVVGVALEVQRLLIAGSQLSEKINVDRVRPQDDVVGFVNPTVERGPAEAFRQDRILAGIEADLALIVNGSRITVDRLKGINVGAFPDLMQDVTLAFVSDLFQVSELRRRIFQLRLDGKKGL